MAKSCSLWGCLLLLAAALLASVATADADGSSDDWDYVLEHSLDGITFTPRNSFRIRIPDLGSNKRKVEFSPYAITADEVSQLQAQSAAGQSYLLRTNVRAPGAKPAYITAHVPACALVASGLVESIIFHLDSAERVIAFEYANEIPAPSDPLCGGEGVGTMSKLKSRGVVSAFTSSKLPVALDGNIFYNAPPGSPQAAAQGGAAAGAGGGQAAQPEPSFFQKYKWYLIIGVGVYVVMGALNNPAMKEQMAAAQAQAAAPAR